MEIVEYMEEAVKKGFALAAFNAPSFEAMLLIADQAANVDKPVIIQTSSRLVHQHGAERLAGWFKTASDQTGAKCFLHLDHCHELEIIRSCINAGWHMVMFDGSHLPLDSNIEKCSQIVKFAHDRGTAVEGEVGAIGGEEDGFEATANYADDIEIERLSEETGINCIAVGFGNVHGDYCSKANLRWDIFESAYELGGIPLVLHGGSGLTDAEFARAIRSGSAKINISTEIKKAYLKAVRDPEMLAVLGSSPAALHDSLGKFIGPVARDYIQKFYNWENTI